MKIFDFFKKNIDKNIELEEKIGDNKKEVKTVEGTVCYYDEFDRKIEVSKKEWLEEVLYPNIKASWEDVDLLCDVVLDAFSKKVYEETKDACLRIYSIDTNDERKANILGVYYIKTKNYDEAISLYERYLTNARPTETIYLNYAKALEIKNQNNEAEKNYLKALKINPNSEVGLNNYLKILKNRNKQEYFNNLVELANIEGAWRSKLRLSTDYFRIGDKAEGNKFLLKALKESNYHMEVMALASGIYGMNGFYDEFEKNILPVFNPEKHGAYTTLNVLEYHKIKRNYIKGLELCKFASKFSWDSFTENFKNYEEIFIKTKLEVESLGNVKEEETKFFSTSRPLWYNEFNNPKFLLNTDKREGYNVLILPFVSMEETKTEREKGSLEIATAIPLCINDILYNNTNVNYQLIFQHKGKEIVIPDQKYSKEYINQIKEQNPKLNYVISGNIQTDYDVVINDNQELIEKPSYQIEVYAYDVVNGQKYNLVTACLEKKEIYKIKDEMIENLKQILTFNSKVINIETDSTSMMAYTKKIKILLDKKENKVYKSWEYKELLNDQLKITLDDLKNDDKKITLISLMYEISIYNSQLLKNVKGIIYNMLNNKLFYSEKIKMLIPIIFNVYRDEINYNKFVEHIASEVEDNVEYVDWLNKFLEYVD